MSPPEPSRPEAVPATEDEESLIEIVSTAYSSVLYVDPPPPDKDLLEDASLDSFSLLQLLVALDERLGLHIQPQDISTEDVRTIRRIAAFVARQRASGENGA